MDGSFSKDRPEQSLGFVFWQTTLLWQRVTSDSLKNLNLTHVQFILLAGLGWLTKQDQSVTQSMLAKHAKTDIMMTSKVLRTLEAKALIKRLSHTSDSRAYTLEITDNGMDVLQKALSVVELVDQEFFSNLGNRKKIFHDDFLEILSHYNKSC